MVVATIRLTPTQARLAWLSRQRLLEPARGRPLNELVSEIGWIPMPSPASPYLALFARGAIETRAELDEPTLRRGEFSMVPGPRGSTWFVPTPEAPLARAFAVADHASREARVASATALSSKELQTTRDSLRAALAKPCTVSEIRAQIPAVCLRSLGDAGKKNGVPTLAALVLRNMWVTGEVMRVKSEGKLDGHEVRWSIDPRPRTVPTAADAVVAIAARWLSAHAPVTAKAFASAFGIAAGRANAALKSIKPVEIEVEGIEGAFLGPPDFAVHASQPEIPVHLLPLRDPLLDVQFEPFMTEAVQRVLPARGPGPTVMVDGLVVGSWSYDEATQTAGWRLLTPDAPDAAVTAQIDQCAVRVAAFIHRELGIAPLHGPAPARTPRGASAGGELAIEM
jgi:hypothetical protein